MTSPTGSGTTPAEGCGNRLRQSEQPEPHTVSRMKWAIPRPSIRIARRVLRQQERSQAGVAPTSSTVPSVGGEASAQVNASCRV